MGAEKFVRRWSNREGGAERANYALFLTELTEALGLATVRRTSKLDTDQPEIELTSAWGTINADLTVGADVTRAVPLQSNSGLCSPGVKLHGAGFIVGKAEAQRLGLGSANRPGLDAHIRPYRNGRDITGRSRNKWVDAHRKARLAEYPELTLTRLYNALEAVRAHDRDPARVLTAEETADAERGAVRTLMAWQEDIDRATLAAYGWSDLHSTDCFMDAQVALGRLVALNAERRLEEARGQVRWLRPDYQASRSRAKTTGVDERQTDVEALLASSGLVPWPREPRPQLLLIKGALAEAELPLSAKDLVARFRGRKAVQDVPRLLATLERLGQVRATSGGYMLLRAA